MFKLQITTNSYAVCVYNKCFSWLLSKYEDGDDVKVKFVYPYSSVT